MTLYSKHSITNIAIPLYVKMNDNFSKENHSMFRIVLVESGTGILKVNNSSLVFMSPSVFCLNERDIVSLEKDCGVKAHVIYFDPTVIDSSFTLEKIYNISEFNKFTNIQDYFYLEPFLSRTEKANAYIEIGLAMYKRVSQLYKMLYDEINPCDGLYWVCRSRSFFLEILFIIQYVYTNLQTEEKLHLPNSSADLNEVLLYLHSNYQDKITIEDLTQIFHINRTTLSEKFRASTGMSIKDYLIKLRIKLSAVMLRDTMLPISEIMNRVGFNEAHHFSRMFSKCMGCLPSDYRKKSFNI